MDEKLGSFFALTKHPIKFRIFLLTRLPSAFFSGVSVKEATEEQCVVTVPYQWFSRNPFRSTYFACLSMAAEMSTGVLAMAYSGSQGPSVSLLVVKAESEYYKKATGVTTFTCTDGLKFKLAVQQAIQSGEPQLCTARSSGVNDKGEPVAEFLITWSFRMRKRSR